MLKAAESSANRFPVNFKVVACLSKLALECSIV
jgi:hypothetical protein